MPQGILSSAMDDISKHLILCVGLVSYFYDHHNHSRNQSLKLIKSSIKYQLGLLCRLASTLEFWNYQVLKHCDNFLYHRNMTANKIQLFIFRSIFISILFEMSIIIMMLWNKPLYLCFFLELRDFKRCLAWDLDRISYYHQSCRRKQKFLSIEWHLKPQGIYNMY